MNSSEIANLPRFGASGRWYRATTADHVREAMATAFTISVKSRFYPGVDSPERFQTLYLAESHEVAMFEARHRFGNPYDATTIFDVFERGSYVADVNIQLSNVVDITSCECQELIGMNCQELTGDWKGYHQRKSVHTVPEPSGIAPTQALGIELFRQKDIEGAIYTSATVPHKRCLVVFPERMLARSYFDWYDPSQRTRVRVNGTN